MSMHTLQEKPSGNPQSYLSHKGKNKGKYISFH